MNQMYAHKRVDLLTFPLLFSAFTVSIDDVMTVVQLAVLASCLFVFFLTRDDTMGYKVDRAFFLIGVFFVFPWVISGSLGLVSTLIGNDSQIVSGINPWGRILNLFLLTCYIISIGSIYPRSGKELGKSLSRAYLWGCIVSLLFAIWQALDFYTSLPISFPFDTRSYVHSKGETGVQLTNRLTGFAAEPSYIAPFLVDGLVLSFFLIKKRIVRVIIVTLFLTVLLMTFSPSAYISLIAIGLVFLAYSFRKNFVLVIALALVIGASTYIALGVDNDIIRYFLYRVSTYEESGRFQGVWNPIEYLFANGGVLNVIFGFGIKSMEGFSNLNYRGFDFSTANNLFTDVLFEGGLVGLCMYVGIFVLLFRTSFSDNDNALPLYLSTGLLVSSLYRSDYASMRFVALICIIYCISEKGRKN